MILAAGRGERMRPLTDATPKPLLKVAGKALIEYHLDTLSAIGVSEVIINIAYLGEQIQSYLGRVYDKNPNGPSLAIRYSSEPKPLETAGALLNALPLLGNDPFILINGDVWTDYPLERLLEFDLGDSLGHLVLVENPPHNPAGDFSIDDTALTPKASKPLTFSGMSLLSPSLIKDYPKQREIFPLGEVFHEGMSRRVLSAEYYAGKWFDIGTVERLNNLDVLLKNQMDSSPPSGP